MKQRSVCCEQEAKLCRDNAPPNWILHPIVLLVGVKYNLYGSLLLWLLVFATPTSAAIAAICLQASAEAVS